MREDPTRSGANHLVLEPRFQLGEVDGPSALNDVLGVAVGPDGSLYVTQWLHPHVAVYSTDGSLDRTIGRAGVGPGELTQAGYVGFVGDTLWVQGDNRVVLFDAEGSFLEQASFRLAFQTSAASYVPARRLHDGAWISEVRLRSAPGVGGQVERLPLLRTTASGQITDTLTQVPGVQLVTRVVVGGRQLVLRVPELAADTHVYTADGSAVVVLDEEAAEGGRGRLRATWVAMSGDTLAFRESTFRFEPFPIQIRKRVAERFAVSLADPTGLAAARLVDELDEQLPWPDRAPPYTAALGGADQSLWLRRSEVADSARWERWAPDGSPIREVWLPADLELHYADSRQVWAETKNNLDVPFLIRFEIVDAGR